MEAKEKASELIFKFFPLVNGDVHFFDDITFSEQEAKNAKQCATIAVDEILKELQEISYRFPITKAPFNYYEQVKIEIENYNERL